MSAAEVEALADKALALLTGTTEAGSRVYAERILPLTDSEVAEGPAIAIYTPIEESQHSGGGRAIYESRCTMRLQLLHTEATEAALKKARDTLLKQVEGLLLAPNSAFITDTHIERVDTVRTSTEWGTSADGGRLVADTQIEIVPVYHAVYAATDTPVSLAGIDIEYDFEEGEDVDLEQTVEAP